MTSKTVGFFLALSIGLKGGAALAVAGVGQETALLGLAGVVVFGAISLYQDLDPPRPPRPPKPPLDRRRGRG